MNKLSRILSLALLPGILICVKPASAIMGGPVMPEYVQFEPADAPDVVNLNTGDFSYTLPVGEVPGPYGNFPISMSYHAGIGPGQEATWVGLGWTLNPGSINRTLRGTPDDQFQGGDLAFIYSYSITQGFSVGWTLSYAGIGLDMSYSSFSGYGMNASVSANFYGIEAGVSFGTSGVGLMGGFGYNGFGINGNIGLHDGGISGGVTVGYSTPGGVTIGASVGVSYEYGGRVASSVGFSAGYKSPDGTTIGFSTSSSGDVGLSVSKDGVGANVNLSSHGYSVGVSVGGTGLAVSQASSSSSHSHSHTASISVPGLFSYSKSQYENWVRQASSEHTYGYMYQAGPALAVDGVSEDANDPVVQGSAHNDWDWKFKGRSLDHVGNPIMGHLKPGYDVFTVASQGISGAFRPFGLTNNNITMSVEPLGETEDGSADNAPNDLFYLLNEAAPGDPGSRQLNDEFTLDNSGNPQYYTRFAYDYCWDKGYPNPYNVNYNGDDSQAGRVAKLLAVQSGDCSRYAYFHSNHLNEGNRLLYSRNPQENLDLKNNFRSRMVFAFMGENGGYFQGEDAGDPTSSIKRGRDLLPSGLMRKRIKDWKEWDGVSDPVTWDYPIFGARRIDPILEGNSNIGRLQGFRITNPDGTQYFFTQPVRSLMTASYTTNQPKGAPGFIDKADHGSGPEWQDLLEDMWGAFTENPISAIGEVGAWAAKLVVGGVESFLFSSPEFTDKCTSPEHTDRYNYSYFMSTNPYATQWLLTEIRGPDFVEFNTSDMSANYGYQVKLNYSEPVPYAWRAPFAPPGMNNDEVPNLKLPRSAQTPQDCEADVYHASFGVKELVYLRSIETATHRADFVLNDPSNEPRQDGKGWIFRWKGKVDNNTSVPGLPILVGTQIPIKQTTKATQHPTEWANVYSRTGETGPFYYTGQIRWHKKDIDYRIDSIYLDVQPTKEQIQNMLDSIVVVTGIHSTVTNQNVSPKLYHAEFLTNLPGNDGLPIGFPLNNKEIDVGFHLDGLPSDPNGTYPDRLKKGNGFVAHVLDIRRATGKELEFGAYKIILKVPITNGTGVRYADFEMVDKNGNVSTAWGDVSENYTHDPDDYIPNNVDVGILKMTSGGGDFKTKSTQPLLTYTGFEDFNNWRGSIAKTDGAYANEMRYLKRIDISDKEEPTRPSRRFVFDYDYSIHPKTLNSYALLPAPTGPGSDQSRLAQHLNSYPQSPLGEDLDAGGEVEKAVTGKLKLKSVREVACGGENCADSLSLPPFRFTYWFEDQTSYTTGETLAETIEKSTDVLDEWGYWNKHASEGNEKAHQYFADYGGTAWSLRQIIDPSGGVMEVNYERDQYRGESYAEDQLAVPVAWEPCPNDPLKVCFDFVPRTWYTYCDRKDRLRGEWRFVTNGLGQSYKYMTDMGFVQDSKLFFNVQQTGVTEVGCGLNLGFWKSSGCDRHRSVSVVGSAKVTGISSLNEKAGYFDYDAYEKDGSPTLKQMHDDKVTYECGRAVTCCDRTPAEPTDWSKRSKYWYCNIDVTRITTDLNANDLNAEFVSTLGKLRDHDWNLDGERFGVVWSRQPSKVLKGGDLRVRELVKRDIGMTQRTRYEYEPGEMAQYPDSVFSSAYAARFSTGKITGTMGDDLSNMNDDQKKAFLNAYRDLPAKSRIYNVGDDNADLLPGASITYPKITMKNVILNDQNQEEIANGRTVYEFCGPEQRGAYSYRINLEAPLVSPELTMRDIYVEFQDANGNQIFTTQRLQVQTNSDGGHFYSGDLAEYVPFNTSMISKALFYYGDPKLGVSKIITGINPSGKEIVNALFSGVLTSATNLGDLHLVGQPSGADRYFPNDIMKVSPGPNGAVVFEDRSSRIGKPRTTTFYRTLKEIGGKEVLVKRDSMVYADVAPSADDRFLGAGTGGADASKLGVQEEQWKYVREIKCGSKCNDKGSKEAWATYVNAFGTAYAPKTVIHRRYPTFLTENWSITGFNGSHQPGELPASSPTDFIITHLTNHRIDPILGKPTFSVAYSGRLPTSPSKATRITPAYTVDSGQSAIDLPNLMFVRNVLETQFREDVFTWDTATTTNNKPSGTAMDFNTANMGGTNGANGGDLAKRLTAVKISPVTQSLSPFWPSPSPMLSALVSRGDFKPRFSLQTGADKIANNAALFEAQPSLNDWSGTEITQVNRFLKPTEQKDANGVYLSSRFDPRGFHQIGIFAPARYFETAVLTAEGYAHSMDDASYLDRWEFKQGNNPEVENDFVKLSDDFVLRHRLDLPSVNGPGENMYALEFQIVADDPMQLVAGFMTEDGTINGAYTFTVDKGQQTRRLLLDGYVSSGPPPTGNGRFFLRNNGSSGTIRIKYLRVYPDSAQSKTFVYDERGKLVQAVDETNLSTYYEYDLLGNLVAIKDDNGIAYSSQKREMTNQ